MNATMNNVTFDFSELSSYQLSAVNGGGGRGQIYSANWRKKHSGFMNDFAKGFILEITGH